MGAEVRSGEHRAGAAARCPYDPSYKNCPATQSQKCVDKCPAITPNGCDCFGC